jgi:hypothetical protein
MFKKSLFLLGIALATVTSSTQAKIGDSFADLVKAYGKPMFTQGASNCWFNRGWGIVAVLDTNNICQAQVYVKVKGTVVTKAEAAKLDNANITVYVPNWTTIPQQSSATFGGGVGYLSTGDTFFAVFEGSFLLDATTKT